MTIFKALAAAGLLAVAAYAGAAEPDAAGIKAAHDLLVSMQADKKLRMTAGSSHYADATQRQAVLDKLAKVPPEVIFSRLAPTVAKLLSADTSAEMTRFYQSSYGKRVLSQTFNSGPTLYAQALPTPTAAEKVQLKQPAYLKADKAFRDAEAAIDHQTFVLMTELAKAK
jgi:hypothetical protein